MAAGRVLFGPGFVADGLGWREALKTTYRRRALETHPDRARAVGRAESELAREFRRVAEAYRVLGALVGGPLPAARPSVEPAPRPPRAARSGPRPAPRAPGPAAARAERPRETRQAGQARRGPEPARAAPHDPVAGASPWSWRAPPAPGAPRVPASVRPEDLPRRKLRFAEFLYYSGHVPWTAFVEAIVWQRRQRPAIGKIAVGWGFLTPEDVNDILERRRLACAQRVPFGEFAVRLGYLTSFQLLALLGRQLRLQRRIGEFFVERGQLDPEEIDDVRRRIARHNACWRE